MGRLSPTIENGPGREWLAEARISDAHCHTRSCVVASMLLFVSAFTVIAGCGEPNWVPVTGSVLLDGKPLDGCAVTFVPTATNSSQGAAASGVADAEGRFSLSAANRPGAAVGEYRVTITKQKTELGIDPATRENRLHVQWLSPPKYGRPETSGICRTVTSQQHDFTMELSSR